MNIQILGPEHQGKEEFDGGKIKAQKPLGFSGQGAVTVTKKPDKVDEQWIHFLSIL